MNWVAENKGWLDSARSKWTPRNSEPLRLRAWLASHVVWDGWDPLTIEGALQYSVIVRETGRMPDDVYSTCPIDTPLQHTDVQIPIVDSHEYGNVPIARASCGVFSPDSIAAVRWRRTRPRADYYGIDTVKVSTAEMKAHNIPASTVSALYVDFYAVGDRSLLEALLSEVSHVGARRAGGLGQVKGWEVTPSEDWSLFGANGELMRSLPLSAQPYAIRATERTVTLRAPYWHPQTRTIGWMPTRSLSSQGEQCA